MEAPPSAHNHGCLKGMLMAILDLFFKRQARLPYHLAAYVLHTTASTIVFLVEAEKAL